MRHFIASSTIASLSLGSLPALGAENLPAAKESIRDVATSRSPEPFYLKLRDGNLLQFSTEKGELKCSVTCSGYAEEGAEVTLFGFGVGQDSPAGNVFISLNELEALALVDNDWQKIYDLAQTARKEDPNSVEPRLILQAFKPLVTEVPGVKYQVKQAAFLGWDLGALVSKQKDPLDLETWDLKDFDFGRTGQQSLLKTPLKHLTTPRISVPVYLRITLDGEALLQMVEVDGQLKFFKTSTGYAVSGTKIHAGPVSAGKEWVKGLLYYELTPTQAKAYVDGDWRKLYKAASDQWRVIENSVSPSLVQTVLAPNFLGDPLKPEEPKTVTSGERKVVDEKRQ